MPVLSARNVVKAVRDGDASREILRGVDVEVWAGEMIAVVGPSGSGKTTLLSILAALDKDFEGEVEILGTLLSKLGDDERTRLRNERFGFVFQSFHLLDHLTVTENVAVPLWLAAAGLTETAERARIEEALALVGLRGRGRERVRRLSGGERQRVAVARAVVNGPRVLFADEPSGHLDDGSQTLVADLFDAVREGYGAGRRGGAGRPSDEDTTGRRGGADRPPDEDTTGHRGGADCPADEDTTGHRGGADCPADEDTGRCAVVVATHDPRLASRASRVFRLREGRLEEVQANEAGEAPAK